MEKFKLISSYQPKGDQPEAIKGLLEGLQENKKYQTLLGVTGSGKTFTMANVIETYNKPTLIISHNKTLAAQLYGEFKSFFPENAIEYFISYYDYYRPEAYIPATDTFIEKTADINDEIDRLRLKATSNLLSRNDTIIVASVSCIFGLGSPKDYRDLLVFIKTGETFFRNKLLRELVNIQYSRNDISLERGTFRVRGDTIEIQPAYENITYRIEFWGDEIERICLVDNISGHIISEKNSIAIYPAKHFVTTFPQIEKAMKNIELELEERLKEFRSEGKLLEAQRLEQRTRYDLEMLLEIGYCSGIENYSRHLSGRKQGERPSCLLDYFPKEYLIIIDESHVTLPQIRAMYAGDRSRKQTLVDFGFRLPSALDNRPLTFDEFNSLLDKIIFLSATPAKTELEYCNDKVIEQVIRPTGLIDPEIIVKPATNQVDDLIEEIRKRIEKKERILVTTLTKRMSEDLTDYLKQLGFRVRYMHSEIQSLERVEILRDLRLAEFDILIGINLLREGLDLPEVSLVAILDADKRGFLRSERSLIQTAGRAARNAAGTVIMYGDTITIAMQGAIDETNRRRKKQLEYNEKYNIIPRSIIKTREEILEQTAVADVRVKEEEISQVKELLNIENKMDLIRKLEEEMNIAASKLEFEKAASIRDRIFELEAMG